MRVRFQGSTAEDVAIFAVTIGWSAGAERVTVEGGEVQLVSFWHRGSDRNTDTPEARLIITDPGDKEIGPSLWRFTLRENVRDDAKRMLIKTLVGPILSTFRVKALVGTSPTLAR